MPYPHKNIRLHSGFYVGQASYFITICREGRRPLFGNYGRAAWLIDVLRRESASHRFAVYAYCVMPDHFHMLVLGLDDRSNLLEFVKDFKRTSELELRSRRRKRDQFKNAHPKTPAEKRQARVAATQAGSDPLWQKKFYDRILRETDNFDGVAGYIWMNPVRKGLCADPRAYSFSGSFVVDWKKIMCSLESWVPEWKRKS
jgi:putative transposase